MVSHTLRPGQHGVVVGHHDRLGGRPTEAVGSNGPQAANQAIGRGVGDQILFRSPAALRGDRQRAVFDEAARVDQISDVLPGSAATLRVPLGDSGLAALVEGEQMPVPDLLEVSARSVEIDRSSDGFAVGAGTGPGENHQRVPGSDDLAGRHQSPHGPQRMGRDKHVLHLHRFEHDQWITGTELSAIGHHLHHGARQLRAQRFLARVELDRHHPGLALMR